MTGNSTYTPCVQMCRLRHCKELIDTCSYATVVFCLSPTAPPGGDVGNYVHLIVSELLLISSLSDLLCSIRLLYLFGAANFRVVRISFFSLFLSYNDAYVVLGIRMDFSLRVMCFRVYNSCVIKCIFSAILKCSVY